MTAPSASHEKSPSSDSLYELVEQLTERMHRGESVDLSQVIAAHPQHAVRLAQVLPALAVLADVHVSSSIAAPAGGGSARSTADALNGMLGDFRLVREIGRGGMGVVYEARQISLDRRVALKVLPFAGVLDGRQLQRFTNEARAAAGLHHPNIVPVYAVGCERGVHYYAMQYIDGRTLADVIRELSCPASGGRKSAGGTALASALIPGENPAEITNVENQMSKEMRKPKAGTTDALLVTGDQCDSEVQPTRGLTPPRSPGSISAPRSPDLHRSLGSRDASTLRILDTSTPARERFRTIAEWGIQIAEALDYAHSVGVIHRDIKPANLMLDSQRKVWVTDFGLAQIETDAGLTMTGDIVGTLRYMSPEQALGERGLVDQRTDVYSLGLALYELLTLKPAFGNANRRELLHRISTDDPIAPRRINPSIPVELETIIQKATEKEAAARYSNARGLADDLRRFLQEQPIKARPATRLERLRKWSRRNRVFVRMCLAFSVLAVVLLAAATVWVDHERQQTKLEQQARAADQKIAAVAYEDLRTHRYATNINLAERAWNSGDFAEACRRLQDCLPGADEPDLRSFEWHYLSSVTRDVAPAFAGHLGSVYCFRLSPDGRTAASGGQDGARIWNFQTGEQLAHFTAHDGDVNAVEFSPDGKLLATSGDDQTARIWDTTTWQLLRTIPHTGNVVACLFTPGGEMLATGERPLNLPAGQMLGDSGVRLWDVGTWESRGELQGPADWLQSLAISDDGALLATGGDAGICVWDLAAKTLLYRLPQSAKGVAFAHQRPLLVSVGGESIDLWRTTDGVHEATLKDAVKRPECVAISRNDSAIVAGGSRGQVQVWELGRDGEYRVNPLLRSTYAIWSATFVDDTTLMTTDRDGGAVRRWECRNSLDRRRVQLPLQPGYSCPDFAISPNGRTVVTATCELNVYDTTTQSHLRQLPIDGSCSMSVAFSPDGKAVASGHASGDIVVFDATTWRKTKVLPRNSSSVTRLEYGLDGEFLAVNYEQAFIDVTKNRVVPCPLPDWTPGNWVRFGPWGHGVCVARGSLVQTWNGNRKLRQLEIPLYSGVTIAPDGRHFACNSMDGTIRIWNLEDERPELVLVGDTDAIGELAFSADGRTLIGTANRDRSVKFWNVATGREMLRLETGLATVHKLAVTADGKTLVVSGMSRSGSPELNLWQVQPQLTIETRQLSIEPRP